MLVEEENQPEPVDKSTKDGWFAITKELKILQENDGITEDNPGGGRPVDLGNEGGLLLAGYRGYGHSVAVDLINGILFLDYDFIKLQNNSLEINARTVLYMCEETNILGEYKHRKTTKPRKNGDYFITYDPMIFRPIWFNRHISTLPGPVYVMGAQTTTPSSEGKRNIKKMVSLYPDGRVGIS